MSEAVKLVYLLLQGEERGPYTLEQVWTMFETSLVTPDTMFKRTEEWRPLVSALSDARQPSPSLGRWFLRVSGEQRGPFIFEQVRCLWKQGQIPPDTRCKLGEIWQPLAKVLPAVAASHAGGAFASCQ